MKITKIETDQSLRELTKHGTEDFLLEYYFDELYNYNEGYISWHWHKEIELVLVLSSVVSCLIGKEEIILYPGDGIFINSNIIHSFKEYVPSNTAIIENIVFSPEFIAPIQSRIYEKYVDSIINSNISYCLITKKSPCYSEIITCLSDVFNLCKSEQALYELIVQEKVLHIWRLLYTNIQATSPITDKKTSTISQARLKQMLKYIETNYGNKITLADIALASNISKSEALRCFKDNFNISPIKYLIEYRLLKAKSMLNSPHKSIAEIALDCGFESASYFNRLFKEKYGFPPKEARNS